MTVGDLIRQLEMFDKNSEVVINPDIQQGRYKNNKNRMPRFSYEPSDEITERSVTIAGIKTDVVCIELGTEVGTVSPKNAI